MPAEKVVSRQNKQGRPAGPLKKQTQARQLWWLWWGLPVSLLLLSAGLQTAILVKAPLLSDLTASVTSLIGTNTFQYFLTQCNMIAYPVLF